jgi:hypothetical protein
MDICGSFTGKQKKPCKQCKRFFMWGVSYGRCDKLKDDVSCREHCKYFKRDSTTWTKDGKCKFDENLLYF